MSAQLERAFYDEDINEIIGCINAGHYENREYYIERYNYRQSLPYFILRKTVLYKHNNDVLLFTALINSPTFDPGHVFNDNFTTLMECCLTRNTKCAMLLLKTGKSNPHHSITNAFGNVYSAIKFAIDANMYQVVYAILTNDFDNSEIYCQNCEFVDEVDQNSSDCVAKLREIIDRITQMPSF